MPLAFIWQKLSRSWKPSKLQLWTLSKERWMFEWLFFFLSHHTSEQHFFLHKLNSGRSSLCQGMKDVHNNLIDLLTAVFKWFVMTASLRGRTRSAVLFILLHHVMLRFIYLFFVIKCGLCKQWESMLHFKSDWLQEQTCSLCNYWIQILLMWKTDLTFGNVTPLLSWALQLLLSVFFISCTGFV